MAKGVKFTREAAGRIVETVRLVERTPRDQSLGRSGANGGGVSEWPARLLAETSGAYTVKEVQRNAANTDWEDNPAGLTSAALDGKTAREVNDTEGLRVGASSGQIVWIKTVIDADGELQWQFQIPGDATFLAKITGNAYLARANVDIGGGSTVNDVEYRWKYAWTEIERDADSYATVSGGRSGTTSSGYAINLAEVNGGAVSTYFMVFGFDMLSTNYPTAHRPRPIGAGSAANTHLVDQVVMMRVTTDVNGNAVYDFDRLGIHGEACE